MTTLVARSCPSCHSIGPAREGCADSWHKPWYRRSSISETMQSLYDMLEADGWRRRALTQVPNDWRKGPDDGPHLDFEVAHVMNEMQTRWRRCPAGKRQSGTEGWSLWLRTPYGDSQDDFMNTLLSIGADLCAIPCTS